ncbi:glycerophosphoryl diester phosphodiesterase [Sphaerisporangium melleum]|uniref:glycerophosphodiester phosphodiesterase n=1 Tax=Sphaerisporangium melleum TaxID=321316 RepID=A0A917VKD3_9ACTN|nr:glycerophosphodiester phosphodiesterase [Sphaerisporangium melleum]GGK89701.1 glycerophosphoryl diester phosphodiesterase [Sphaerisporangium melleum]GII72526.1 glycerophosphoryl diester phosphodiesterase [Sphaerisporangium melleum]
MVNKTMSGVLAVLACGVALVGLQPETATADKGRHDAHGPVVIGHRGASALRPEHTLPSYETAIALGADYIEPDLVSTKDHVLVARHENEISGTTDVANHPEFAARKTTKTIDGVQITGWFTEDFTLDELRTLRAKERIPDLRPDNTAFDGLAQIPTFEEVVRLARKHGVGVYPETKHPTYFDSIGLSLEEPLLATLKRYGWDGQKAPVFVQSFETGNLKRLRGLTRLRLVQLINATGAPYDLVAAGDPRTYDDLVTPEGLREIATYADAVGVATQRIVPPGPDGRLLQPTALVKDAHRRGLLVHTWTVRPENSQLPVDYRQGDPASPAYPRATGDVMGWLTRLFSLGVDGVFSDDPGIARAVRDHVLDD